MQLYLFIIKLKLFIINELVLIVGGLSTLNYLLCLKAKEY